MGLFGAIKKAAKWAFNPVGAAAGAIIGGGDDKKAREAQERQEAERRAQQQRVVDQQTGQAKEFRQNLAGYIAKGGQAADREARGELESSSENIKRGANRRGLLGSGIEAQDQADNEAGIASGLAARKAQIQKNLQNAATEFEQKAAQGALQVANFESDIQDSLYNQALADMNAKGTALSGLAGGIGSIAGTLIGGKK